jgi:hypothetical protein
MVDESNMSKVLESLDEDVGKGNKQNKPDKVKPTKNILSVGLDVGTMYIGCSRSDLDEVKLLRNVFLPLSKDDVTISDLTDISYVEDDEENLYIIGDDAFTFSNIFGQKVSRPMEKGLISPKEISAIDVLTLMIRSLFGNIENKEVYCSYSIPAEAIDEGKSVTYHEQVFARILSGLGVNYTSVNEAMAIVYSEAAKENFSAMAISFGAGMCNTALSFKGVDVLKFSTARSGDWVDSNAAESIGVLQNRVTSIKEKYLDLEEGFANQKNKKTRRVLEALTYYYTSLMEYTIKKIIHEFSEQVDVEIDTGVPLIISGGTSLPNGFIDLFKSVLSKYELPFEITEVRRARNPLTAVSNGLLIKTLSDVRSL